jgi:hypothetical protein
LIGSLGRLDRFRELAGGAALDHLNAKAGGIGSKISWQLGAVWSTTIWIAVAMAGAEALWANDSERADRANRGSTPP